MKQELISLFQSIPQFIINIPLPDEKFLYFFTPGKLDQQCLFGFSLKTGVKVFSIMILCHAINVLMDLIHPGTLWNFLMYSIVFITFIFIAAYSFYSTINENYIFVKFSYIIIGLIFAYQTIKYGCKSILRFIAFITPWGKYFFNMNLFVYVLGKGIYLFIGLYFIWILYCYMLSIKGANYFEVINVEVNEDLEKSL